MSELEENINSQPNQAPKPYEYRVLDRGFYNKHQKEDSNYTDWYIAKTGGEIAPFDSSEEMRAKYIYRTEELIEKIVQGECDVVVYLDKSARPLSWMTSELWSIFAPDHEMPQRKFVNIDRDQLPWRGMAQFTDYPDDPDLHGKFDEAATREMVRKLTPQEAIDELRRIFGAQFDGKRLLIVDEIIVNGSTAVIAEEVFKIAFPKLEGVDRFYWLSPAKYRNKAQTEARPAEFPVWYSENRLVGRGVLERGGDTFFLSEPGNVINPNFPFERYRDDLTNEKIRQYHADKFPGGLMSDDQVAEFRKKLLSKEKIVQAKKTIIAQSQKQAVVNKSLYEDMVYDSEPDDEALIIPDQLALYLREDIRHLKEDITSGRQGIFIDPDDLRFYDMVDGKKVLKYRPYRADEDLEAIKNKNRWRNR